MSCIKPLWADLLSLFAFVQTVRALKWTYEESYDYSCLLSGCQHRGIWLDSLDFKWSRYHASPLHQDKTCMYISRL